MDAITAQSETKARATVRYHDAHVRAVEIVTEYNRLAEVIRNLPTDEMMSEHGNQLRKDRDALAHQAVGLLSIITGV